MTVVSPAEPRIDEYDKSLDDTMHIVARLVTVCCSYTLQ